ncbi:MAG TPA: ATP-binding protein [Desulfomicrobiaceae bacterium]|nr:ATP-binding protein [Desulfomicrobiaceae bacterium]
MFWDRIKPPFWDNDRQSDPRSLFNYRQVWKIIILCTAGASTLPLLLLTFMNLTQYQEAMHTESIAPVSRLISNTKRSITGFLKERSAALNFLVHNNEYEELIRQEHLARIFRDLKLSFGGFIDLGIIDSNGVQRSYVGPYNLQGKNYKEQAWFSEALVRGSHISDAFLGFRDIPHMVIAIKSHSRTGRDFLIRATIDTEYFVELIDSLGLRPGTDAFLVNRSGRLQTPSLLHGKVLEPMGFPVPAYSEHTEVLELEDENGNPLILGYAYIPDSPFIFLLTKEPLILTRQWSRLRNTVLFILGLSLVVISVVNLGVVTFLVNRIYQADTNRLAALHQAEHTNKMASIGRLAAGVAHEINNPLAIINERAGLIKDLLQFSPDYNNDPKLLKLVDSIINSVQRCSTITHRLLGFARHIDVSIESLNLGKLVHEVLGFLQKEAEYRDITIFTNIPEDFPDIKSDRGQLQQVFLNIINNAFAAVSDGGRIDITMGVVDQNHVRIAIQDNGYGISRENIKRVFEPFFSTKTKTGGTGLGLSITYGLVQKLGGTISVQSKEGEGTCFTIVLPVKA